MASKRTCDSNHSGEGDPEICKFRRVTISEDEPTAHSIEAQNKIAICMKLRNKWITSHPSTVDPVTDSTSIISVNDGSSFNFVDGVAQVHGPTNNFASVVHDFQSFVEDYQLVRKTIYTGIVKTYVHTRLGLLAAKFNLHVMLNAEKELAAQKAVSHRDIYNVRKVDTHVHHSCSMTQKHLLKFIKRKVRHHSDDVVCLKDGKPLTLGQVFESYNLTAYDLSIDSMDMHAHDTFERFDRFNQKFNPIGKKTFNF